MHRRDVLKALASAWLAVRGLVSAAEQIPSLPIDFRSAWAVWPDTRWLGPEYWANRLQDWRLEGGRAVCELAGRQRTLHVLTHRLGDTRAEFSCSVTIEATLPAGGAAVSASSCVGFRLGATGPHDDVRSAAVYGRGLDVGVAGDGRLRIGDQVGATVLDMARPVTLAVTGTPQPTGFHLRLTARDPDSRQVFATLERLLPDADFAGNIALLSHIDGPDQIVDSGVVRFADWRISGSKIVRDERAAFGPVAFAQYTLHEGTLKLTAQLLPFESMAGHRVFFEVRTSDGWQPRAEPSVDPVSRTAHVRVEDWRSTVETPYRIRVVLPLTDGPRTFTYEGTIAREPIERQQVRLAMFSCNADHGFPDTDVVTHVRGHRPDITVFLGDQFYESHGGFGIERGPLDRSSLDMLRKWYMFGWSYRELFRHIPSAMIPDDHDVYHGNIWGEGGLAAPTGEGWGYVAQDQGGYKMEPAWVNAVQRAQTSHLPDPFDPTPVAQGIGVYYAHWRYAGISFAILEDRKFKTAPGRVLPAEAKVVNGFATNAAFDHRAHRDLPDANLLGKRQDAFLDTWASTLGADADFKVVLSQSPFAAVHTLPVGSTDDNMVPGLPVPPVGEYVAGDAPAADMDTNAWPAARRDDAVATLRRAAAVHLAGDQHLGTVIQYGVREHRDAGFAFTGPALNNIWPRRWWPTLPADHQSMPGRAAYTGDFEDAFGNKVTMVAAANPRQTGLTPAIIHDRATGYGIVVFDRAAGTVRFECWPRGNNPATSPTGQFDGWPVTVHPRSNRIIE
jgi:alkaline phosphatase D